MMMKIVMTCLTGQEAFFLMIVGNLAFGLEHLSRQTSNEVLRDITGYKNKDYVPEVVVSAVEGSSADLPCNMTPPNIQDRPRLVLWFKNDSAVPIYSYDLRGKSHSEARHWSDSKCLGGRGYFRGGDTGRRGSPGASMGGFGPPQASIGKMAIDSVLATDAGSYKCRVDFFKAPTQISKIILSVIVPSEKPRIYDDRGKEVRLKLGPYTIGQNVVLRCEAWGGRPPPRVYWWRDHSLLDDSFESSGVHKVLNILHLNNLQRKDLHSILTCQASNNNISAPVATSVKLDMHFGPLSVSLLNGGESVSAGRRYEAKCQVVGARPKPMVTWWKGTSQMRDNISIHTSPDGNVTLSSLTFIPNIRDAGKVLGCRAADHTTGEGSMDDGWKLNVNYVPEAILSLGSSLNGSNIKEGDDVYFECNVRSNPKPYKISWRRNESPLVDNLGAGVIVSNQSLVLQRVRRSQSGIYTCVAHNIEGDGVSNPITLNVRYVPYCLPDQVWVYGVARYEKIRITCDVISNPSSDLSFQWVFNTTAEKVDIQKSSIAVHGTRSIMEYIPRTELDYGTLLCWGKNSIGRQSSPCTYHLIPAGRPDPVHNCTIHNQTFTSLQVSCGGGFDGGLVQSFVLELSEARTVSLVSNTSSRRPSFSVSGLQPGEGYIVTVYAVNAKGRSEPMNLHAFTLRETSPKQIMADTRRQQGLVITPVLGILIAIGAGLALVAVSIILVMRLKHGGLGKNTGHYHGTHIPLQKAPHFNHPMEDDHKEPDIIPQNKEYIEEEEAFETYREQRYATIARTRPDNDYETLRGFRNNISRLSQEVTYAELTMPRGKGYTQMRRAGQDNVLYTKVDHCPTQRSNSRHLSTQISTSCLARPASPGQEEGVDTPLVRQPCPATPPKASKTPCSHCNKFPSSGSHRNHDCRESTV